MKNLLLLSFFFFSFLSFSFSQENYWVSTQLPGLLPSDYQYSLGETCVIFADDTSQAVHAFDINQGEWQILLIPTQLDWTEAVADGNAALIFNDSIVVAYSALTSTFSAITFSGSQSSLNITPYGCIDNFAWFLTDQLFYVFDAEDGQWRSFSYTHPGEMPWGGGCNGKDDYIYLSLWINNTGLQNLVAYSLQTKTFTEFTESNIESFQLLDHGFTFNSDTYADPYYCGGYSALTGEITTKTFHRKIYETDPGVSTDIVTPLICELFTAGEEISGNIWRYYMWVYNTVVGDFAEYTFEYTYNHNHYFPRYGSCGGQTAFLMIQNVDEGDKLECLVYSALTNSFSLFDTPMYDWGLMSFTAGGLLIEGFDENNYFLYDVQTQNYFTHPVNWEDSDYPGIKGLGNYWSVFAYTEHNEDEDITHVISYSREDGVLQTFETDQKVSNAYYGGNDLFGLQMMEQGLTVNTWFFAPAANLWTFKDYESSSYRGSNGNYFYINYPDQNQTWFYDALANQEYLFPSAQQTSYVFSRDSVFLMYSAEDKYIGYSVIEQNTSEYTTEKFNIQQWSNFIVLIGNSMYGSPSEYLLYDGYNNLFAPLILTGETGNGETSWPGGKTALVMTQNGYLYAYYPGDITSTEEQDEYFKPEDAITFQLFPNPAQDKLKAQIAKLKVENSIIEIYDLNGRKLLEKQIPAGSETIEIDVSSLQSGVYFCRLICKNISASKMLIIQK